MFAKDVMFSTSFLMLIVTFVFSFFKLYLIELGVFVLLIATCLLLIYFHSKSMYNKYMEMKMRKDALDKKKSEQASSNTEQASQQKPETKAKKSTDKK